MPCLWIYKRSTTKKVLRYGFFCDECNRRKEEKRFLEDAKTVHSNFYDYSKTVFKGWHKKLTIICPKHGEFEQQADVHIKGHGCPYCTDCKKLTKWEFVKRAKKIHGDFYDYSKVNYINNHEKVEIICPKHGSFMIEPNSLLNGRGCRECYLEKSTEPKISLEEAKELWNKSDRRYIPIWKTYKGFSKKMNFICPKHGIFTQTAGKNISGEYRCPRCSANISNVEKEVAEYVQSLVGKDKVLRNVQNVLKDENGRKRKYEIDIYIPSMKIGIEVNGEYWHKKREKQQPGYHKYKSQLIKKNGITLINIAYRGWVKDKEQIYNKIRKKIYGY